MPKFVEFDEDVYINLDHIVMIRDKAVVRRATASSPQIMGVEVYLSDGTVKKYSHEALFDNFFKKAKEGLLQGI